ncbi:uncharacterized protein LOC126266922 [Schistocerca gregaria]|uniref:uncharacterized protein LOC126266922 n=1 Tax=Schistocerca gregaria TaxID=7010 RepID=UPI00211EB784|nr:uncharacterized protein LOC126266922 [Schistocerca gregaria]
MEQLMQALIEQQTQLTATIQAQQTQLTAAIQALSTSLTHRLSSSSPPPFPPYDEAAEDWEDYEKRLRQHFLAFGVVDAPLLQQEIDSNDGPPDIFPIRSAAREIRKMRKNVKSVKFLLYLLFLTINEERRYYFYCKSVS